MLGQRPPHYATYLLRCWEVRSDRPGKPGTWRFSLEEAGTGERHAFPNLRKMVAFLEAELESAAQNPPEGLSRES